MKRTTSFFILLALVSTMVSVDSLAVAATKPDLIMDSLAVSPLQPAAGQMATITVTGHYEGPNPLVSNNGLKNVKKQFPGFTMLTAVEPTVSLASPLQSGSSFQYVYTGSFVSGAYTLYFGIDNADELDEVTNQNNGVSLSTIIFNENQLSDLAWKPVVASKTSVVSGETVTLTASSVYTGQEPLLSMQGIGAIQAILPDFTIASETHTPTVTADAPLYSGGIVQHVYTGSFAGSGGRLVSFTMDPENVLWEKNELNNVVNLAVTIADDTTVPPVIEIPTTTPPQVVNWSQLEKGLVTSVDTALTARFKGSILLQVEEHGEAWYVRPENGLKYYMENGAVAYDMLRAFGLGITDADLAKIPVGLESRFADTDSDSDGLPDKLEEGLKTDPADADSDNDGVNDGTEVLTNNTNPLGTGSLVYSAVFANRLKGKIVLQVQTRGEAWYIHPVNGKRYYMKNGDAAYQIMRYLSQGISDSNLRKIGVGEL